MFKETKEGQTHSYNDGCGEPEHNNMKNNLQKTQEEQDKKFEGEFNDRAYLEMPTKGGFTQCIQQRNGMPAILSQIKSYLSSRDQAIIEAVKRDLMEMVEKEIKETKRWYSESAPFHCSSCWEEEYCSHEIEREALEKVLRFIIQSYNTRVRPVRKDYKLREINMTLQNKIEEQMKEFDEKFPELKLERVECEGVGDNNGFYTFTPKTITIQEVKSFLSTCQQELIQEVVRMCEERKRDEKEIHNETRWNNQTYNSALSDIISELKGIK